MSLPSKSHFNRKLYKGKAQSKKRNDSQKIACLFLSMKIFVIFLFYATFLPSKSLFNRQLCKRKTLSKKRNESRKIACFLIFGGNFHDFHFFMQRLCLVDHILIVTYTRVKNNLKKSQWQPEIACFFCRWKFSWVSIFYATFLPSKSLFNRQLCKRKTQSKKRNDSRKITCFLIFWWKLFHDFPFLCNVSAQ